MTQSETVLKRIALGFSALAATSLLSWGTWVTIAVSQIVRRSEVVEIVRTAAPYIEDRKMIISSLDRIKETEGRLVEVINQNTEAINGLKVEIAKSNN